MSAKHQIKRRLHCHRRDGSCSVCDLADRNLLPYARGQRFLCGVSETRKNDDLGHRADMRQCCKEIAIVLRDPSIATKTFGDQCKDTDRASHLRSFASRMSHDMCPPPRPEGRFMQGSTHTILLTLEDRISRYPIGHRYGEAGLPPSEDCLWKRVARTSGQEIL